MPATATFHFFLYSGCQVPELDGGERVAGLEEKTASVALDAATPAAAAHGSCRR